MNFRPFISIALVAATFFSNSFCKIKTRLEPVNTITTNLVLDIDVAKDDYLYIDYLSISADHPGISISKWETYTPVVNHFDPFFNETKNAFAQPASLSMSLSADNWQEIDHAQLHVSYYLASQNSIVEQTIPIELHMMHAQAPLQTQIDIPSSTETQTNDEQSISREKMPIHPEESQGDVLKGRLDWITNTLQKSNSILMRLLLVFLLGLLMSLTPCIYPMVPITAGILQTQASRSLITSFFLALSYTFGIATTFSILGLLAAFAGQAMGQLMSSPFFIIPLILLMVYLALSMIGLYEMYIPRFLQPRDHQVNGGSFISAFTFGAISGVVASPCLSPGLVCLLCLVTTLNSKLLGFLLLFTFGVGLSVPLLIIGTFSSSLTLLPRAGMWMVEVKKIFGFLMLGMCLYFLNNIIPWHLMAWIIAACALIIGIIFLRISPRAHSKPWRLFYTIAGLMLIALSLLGAFKAIQARYMPIAHSNWHSDYEQARAQAIEQNKKLFVDIGAPFCSICKAIDATLLASVAVREFLEKNTVPVKIDGSLTANKAVLEQFHVLGFPTILLVEPHTQKIIKQWGPEAYGANPEHFIQDLQKSV